MADQTLDPLTPEQYGVVMDDISRAGVALEVWFSIRFDWRKHLPWLLIGMANPRVDRAKHVARQCIIEYNTKQESEHHRKSILFLKPGSRFRLDIDKFISSSKMSDLLMFNVAAVALIPLGDRQIEREHLPMAKVANAAPTTKVGHSFSGRRFLRAESIINTDSKVSFFVYLQQNNKTNTRRSSCCLIVSASWNSVGKSSLHLGSIRTLSSLVCSGLTAGIGQGR